MDFFEENSIRFSPNKTQTQKDTQHSRFKEELNKINLIKWINFKNQTS